MRYHTYIKPRPLREWISTIHSIQLYRTPRALWLALASALILTIVMVLGAVSPSTHTLEPNFHVPFVLLANALLFIPLYLYNFWLIRCGLRSSGLIASCLAGSLAIAALFTLLSFQTETIIYGAGNLSNPFTINLIANAASALVSSLITLLLNNVTRQQQLVLENEHLQSENILTRYQTLQQQISPHFLFNSLNTLDGLIGTDDNNAHNYLQQLAATFRYTMQDAKEVTLEQELSFTHSYIYMMQIRHGGNLHVDEFVSPEFLPLHLPPISLQLLVENAIKHNVISQRHPLTVTILTVAPSPQSPYPLLRVTNPLQPKTDSESGGGMGLGNLSLRYELLYHVPIAISQSDSQFTVDIPLI
ncbi:MAG: histidine kinase [Bacteroidales bacterium]|nr:histidine kinase [Bacteroidales bacterium]MBR3412938.1 histidine kinase [Bacteroidales bacterium]